MGAYAWLLRRPEAKTWYLGRPYLGIEEQAGLGMRNNEVNWDSSAGKRDGLEAL